MDIINITKRFLFTLIFLPIFAHAQLPKPTKDNQTLISKNGTWGFADASLNLGSNYLIGITQNTKLLDTVTNATGMYYFRGFVNPTTLTQGGVCSLTVDYTDQTGKLQQNFLLYQMKGVGWSNWAGCTLLLGGNTRVTIWGKVNVGSIGNVGATVSEVAK